MHDLETYIGRLPTTQGWNSGNPFVVFPNGKSASWLARSGVSFDRVTRR